MPTLEEQKIQAIKRFNDIKNELLNKLSQERYNILVTATYGDSPRGNTLGDNAIRDIGIVFKDLTPIEKARSRRELEQVVQTLRTNLYKAIREAKTQLTLSPSTPSTFFKKGKKKASKDTTADDLQVLQQALDHFEFDPGRFAEMYQKMAEEMQGVFSKGKLDNELLESVTQMATLLGTEPWRSIRTKLLLDDDIEWFTEVEAVWSTHDPQKLSDIILSLGELEFTPDFSKDVMFKRFPICMTLDKQWQLLQSIDVPLTLITYAAIRYQADRLNWLLSHLTPESLAKLGHKNPRAYFKQYLEKLKQFPCSDNRTLADVIGDYNFKILETHANALPDHARVQQQRKPMTSQDMVFERYHRKFRQDEQAWQRQKKRELQKAIVEGKCEWEKDSAGKIMVKHKGVTHDANQLLIEYASGSDDVVVKKLLEAGADPNADNGIETALTSAARGSFSPNMVKVLIDQGAIINKKDPKGKTPLIAATIETYGSEREAVIQYLIEQSKSQNISIDEPDDHGQTALMYAVHTGREGLIKLHLENGASVFSTTRNGDTVFDFADNAYVAKILLDYICSEDNVSKYTEEDRDFLRSEINGLKERPQMSSYENWFERTTVTVDYDPYLEALDKTPTLKIRG